MVFKFNSGGFRLGERVETLTGDKIRGLLVDEIISIDGSNTYRISTPSEDSTGFTLMEELDVKYIRKLDRSESVYSKTKVLTPNNSIDFTSNSLNLEELVSSGKEIIPELDYSEYKDFILPGSKVYIKSFCKFGIVNSVSIGYMEVGYSYIVNLGVGSNLEDILVEAPHGDLIFTGKNILFKD